MNSYTSKEEFGDAYSTLFSTFAIGRTKSIAWRKWQLKQCWWMIEENEDRIVQALRKDLGRHEVESRTSDILGLKGDILHTLTNVEKWAADEKPDAGILFGTLGNAKIRKEPLGPLYAAIAAGCCAVLKPSELAHHSQELLVELTAKYLDPRAIRIMTGGPQETAHILERKFDIIFFTGSSKVARFITAAAAKHLTPVVLELGGQGPAIVTKTANVDLAAKRIALAKFSNAGQICLSVNHVYADPDVCDKLAQRMGYWNGVFLQEGKSHFCNIVNERNWDRLIGLLEKTEGSVVYGGGKDRSTCHIEPTVVANVTLDDSLLSEELFGPICPIIKADYKTAVKGINRMPHPLAIYIFSSDKKESEYILNNTISGGVTINDTLMHAGVPNAPFGGVGESGYGFYHGEYGFKAFTHLRTVVGLPTWLDSLMSFRYPPYNMKTVGSLAVKNKLGFKKGETMEDQKIGAGKSGLSTFVSRVGIILVLLGAFDGLTGRLGFLPVMMAKLKQLRGSLLSK